MARRCIVGETDLEVPFNYLHLGIALAYNGEIYNHREVRQQLDGPWATDCDAEVFAAAWRAWGAEAFNRLNGMWCAILVDYRTGMIIASRDRAGEKGLYYAQRGDSLYLASEAKALPVPLEPQPCADVLTFEYDTFGETPLAGVRTLAPGSFIYIAEPDDVTDPREHTWWSFPEWDVESGRQTDLIEEAAWLVEDAIRIRRPDQYPYGVPLSGGLDSSLIQAVIPSDKTFCVSFPDEDVDNHTAAETASQGWPPQVVSFTLEQMLEAMPKVAYHLDTPATWTACCQWFLFKTIAAAGLRVAVGGEGADELFYGYSRYRILYWLIRMQQDPRLAGYAPTIQAAAGKAEDVAVSLLDRGGTAESREHAQACLQRWGARAPTVLDALARTEFYTTMQVLLRMADKIGSAHAVEVRSPFLDHRLLELSTRIPVSLKVTAAESKSILRSAAQRAGVPDPIVSERTKKGLAIPWPAWQRRLVDGCQGEVGTRGIWDRSRFSAMMRKNWLKSLCRDGLCDICQQRRK